MVAVRPETGWTRIANRESYSLTLAIFEWLFLAVITSAAESWGMITLGAGTNSIGGIFNLSLETIINYQMLYSFMLFTFALIASLIIYFCVCINLNNISFKQVLIVVLYLTSSAFLVKFIDLFPQADTWVCFTLSIIVITVSSYCVVPQIFCPNTTDGFSMFFLISIIISSLVFCNHYICVSSLNIG